MTRTQLARAVARSTGESARRIRRMGFSVIVTAPQRRADDKTADNKGATK